MNKEEILAKSRIENKNRDIYEIEILKTCSNYAVIVAVVLATVFFVIQILTGGGINYGLYAIVFSVSATNFIIKYWKLRKKHELIMAVLYVVIVLAFTASHICSLISSSTIL